MLRLQGRARAYDWGGTQAIPALFGYAPAQIPVAELWFGAHPDDSATVGGSADTPLFDPAQLYPKSPQADHRLEANTQRRRRRLTHWRNRGRDARNEREASNNSATAPTDLSLREYIARDPVAALGPEVARHSSELPYLLKIIAPEQPLSLQVHPSLEQARFGFAREDAAGIARNAPERNYRDTNHKPELAYALTPFEALAGFRTSRRIAGVLSGLNTELSARMLELMEEGIGTVFSWLLSAETRPDSEQIQAVVEACAARLARGESPSPRADRIVGMLAERYPEDPGVIASLLLNPLSLRPGESVFVPAGTVHAYLSGTAIEIMASSDNVLRAGLTHKHVDVPELLRIMDTVAAPPIRIAPERMSAAVSTFYAPVDDFELSVVRLRDATATEALRARGPRTVLCLEGAAQLTTDAGSEMLNTGQAIFVPDAEGQLRVRGFGELVVASVP
ncbi:Mannose-6-phosphate isomerase [Actinobaculum suis]|uniref:mannose-6-phosphate isomerase n=1 Tax=Actinobaculum suis TaxID=1657 RepID=A0A7Z8Y8A7_9ACTO|nr:mannose-6-phosphate isomerase, class I [Actinobaculum suis]VDG75759.1 Mannose-6-phosphate isomerase [Actinobaculum suis]